MRCNRNTSAGSDDSSVIRNDMRHSRRGFLKGIVCGTLAALVAPGIFAVRAHAAEARGGRVLILYFSHSGNTRRLAEMIHEGVGGEMIELKTVSPYPQDYDAVVDLARQEQREHARPALSTELPDLSGYDTVFIGYPNWWGTLPMPFFTLLETYRLDGKNIVPFCTHEGSRFGRSVDDLRKLCPGAHILDGFEVRGSRVSGAREDVAEWLSGLNLSSAD